MFGWILRILGPFCNLFTSFFFKVAAWLLQFIMNASHFTFGSSDGRNSRSPGGQRHYFPLVFLSFQHIFVTLKKHEFWIWCTLIDFTLNKFNCPSTFPFSFLSPFPVFISFLCPFTLRVMFSFAHMLKLLQSSQPYQGLLSLAISLIFFILQVELWMLSENEAALEECWSCSILVMCSLSKWLLIAELGSWSACFKATAWNWKCEGINN